MHRYRGRKIFSLAKNIQVRTTATATKQAVSAHCLCQHVHLLHHEHTVSSRLVHSQVDGLFPAAGRKSRFRRSQHPRQPVSENGPRLSQNGLSQNHSNYRREQRVGVNRSYKDRTHKVSPPTKVSDPNPASNHEHQGNGQDLHGILHLIPPTWYLQNPSWTIWLLARRVS